MESMGNFPPLKVHFMEFTKICIPQELIGVDWDEIWEELYSVA